MGLQARTKRGSHSLGRVKNLSGDKKRSWHGQIRTKAPEVLGSVLPTRCPQDYCRLPRSKWHRAPYGRGRNIYHSEQGQKSREGHLGWKHLYQFCRGISWVYEQAFSSSIFLSQDCLLTLSATLGLKTTITQDGTWRIRKVEKSPVIEVFRVEESGHGDILSSEFTYWREKMENTETKWPLILNINTETAIIWPERTWESIDSIDSVALRSARA